MTDRDVQGRILDALARCHQNQGPDMILGIPDLLQEAGIQQEDLDRNYEALMDAGLMEAPFIGGFEITAHGLNVWLQRGRRP